MTIVNVAMPDIGRTLHASGAALQLVVAGYTVSYAMLLITGARLGALFGRRRLFLAGVALFTVSSLVCGLAPDATVLIVARFVQGAGAAAMVPQIISVIQARFTGAARARALSAYSAVLAAGFVCGQVLGGVIVSANLSGTQWRPVFLVNVPIGLAVLALVPRVTPAGADVPAAPAPRAGASLFLTLAGHGRFSLPASPHAIALTSGWLALLFTAGAVAALPLSRTVVKSRRADEPGRGGTAGS